MTDKDKLEFEQLLDEIAPYANHLCNAEGVYVDAFARGAFVIYQHTQAARAESAKEMEGLRNALRDIVREYREHDAAAVDVMASIAMLALAATQNTAQT